MTISHHGFTLWLTVQSTVLILLISGLFSKDFNCSQSTHNICHHLEKQLYDIIKSIGWYQAFMALPIQIWYYQNSTDTNTGISAWLWLITGWLHQILVIWYKYICYTKLKQTKPFSGRCRIRGLADQDECQMLVIWCDTEHAWVLYHWQTESMNYFQMVQSIYDMRIRCNTLLLW